MTDTERLDWLDKNYFRLPSIYGQLLRSDDTVTLRDVIDNEIRLDPAQRQSDDT